MKKYSVQQVQAYNNGFDNGRLRGRQETKQKIAKKIFKELDKELQYYGGCEYQIGKRDYEKVKTKFLQRLKNEV